MLQTISGNDSSVLADFLGTNPTIETLLFQLTVLDSLFPKLF